MYRENKKMLNTELSESEGTEYHTGVSIKFIKESKEGLKKKSSPLWQGVEYEIGVEYWHSISDFRGI